MKESIEALVKRLNAIAKRNHDSFKYRIELRGWPIKYHFIAEETADNHEFVNGYGSTIDDAVIDADNQIENACREWCYES